MLRGIPLFLFSACLRRCVRSAGTRGRGVRLRIQFTEFMEDFCFVAWLLGEVDVPRMQGGSQPVSITFYNQFTASKSANKTSSEESKTVLPNQNCHNYQRLSQQGRQRPPVSRESSNAPPPYVPLLKSPPLTHRHPYNHFPEVLFTLYLKAMRPHFSYRVSQRPVQ